MKHANPGDGAIEYATSLVTGLTREQAVPLIEKLLTEASDDPRIKLCVSCGYPFRDKTRPNRARVCCQTTCKTVLKTVQRSIQRARGSTAKAVKPVVYVRWLEYPYWLSEKAMLRHVGSYERSYDPDKVARISAARQRSEHMGGRLGRRNSAKNRRKADY